MNTTATTTAPAAAAETTAPAAVFTVSPAHLDRALRIAVLAAANDATLPILSAVALTVTEAGNLVTVATDRYKLVRALVDTATEGRNGETFPRDVAALEAHPAVIPAADVKTLTAWIKPQIKTLGGWGHLTVTVEGRTDTDPGRLTVTSPEGGRYTVNLLDGEYPKVQRLLADWTAGDNVGLFAVNPAYLEVIAKMAKLGCERNTPVTVHTGATAGKPVQFRGGTGEGLTFEALLMPVRLPATAPGAEPPAGL